MKRALELLVSDELQVLLDHFAACFGVRIALFAPDGAEIQTGLRKSSCSFCNFLRLNLGLVSRCRDSDGTHFQEAAINKHLVVYTCHAGLTEAIHPVYLEGGEPAGFIMIGQFRTGNAMPAQALLKSCRSRNERLKVQRHFNTVPQVSTDRLPHMLGIFKIVVDAVMARRLVRVRGELLLARVERFIRDEIHRPISLGEAARAAGRSPSTVSHLYRSRLDQSFKQTVIAAKLDEAERLIHNIPGITVAEAAARVGYPDPFHFSRLYKKHRGTAPSILKAQAGKPSPMAAPRFTSGSDEDR